jgi:endonuclease/exonuclease/phosphatase family metal-dependent hydrolase
MMIPAIVLANIVLLVLSIRRFNLAFALHLAAVVIGFVFIRISFGWFSAGSGDEDLRVLSYNVRVFNNYEHFRDHTFNASREMISWAVDYDADIKCFQEYYNLSSSDIFNVTNRLRRAGWNHHYNRVVWKDRANAEFGIAIFSRHPIVRKGSVKNEDGQFGNIIFADIVKAQDTIRVYNVHLQSMSIDEENVLDTEKLRKSYKETGYRLRRGFISRALEVNGLLEHIRSCRHPIVLCGDFNELPYSYPYFAIRALLRNAFEKAGRGLGFSYNGKLFFLRIDNQFYSPEMEVLGFTTHRDVKYSDHFPISAAYSLKKP